MSAFIKLSTQDYPRHAGDIAIDPAGMADYAHVEWVDQPEFDSETQRCHEGTPVEVDGVWHMTWVVRDATPEEIEQITGYNGNIRKNYAGIGYTYQADIDAFVPPKPYASWVLNNDTAQWEAPTPMPADDKRYSWNEETQSWIETEGL